MDGSQETVAGSSRARNVARQLDMNFSMSPTKDVKSAYPKNHTTVLTKGIKVNPSCLRDECSGQRYLSDIQRGQIVEARLSGASVTEIFQLLGVSRGMVSKVMTHSQHTHSAATQARQNNRVDRKRSSVKETKTGIEADYRVKKGTTVAKVTAELNQHLDSPVSISYNGDRFNSCQVIYSQFGLAIYQNDHQARRRFVEWAQNEIAVVPDFHKRILFSDEAHFWLNGYVNKQNCRIWSEANPQVYVERPLHPEKLTVWCSLWAGGIIGPYFFKNDEGHNITVNGDRYRAMITNFFIPELNNHDVQELWFQQDGATCHTARTTIDLLKDTFGDRLISRFGPVNWPP
ncbi:uncharacterized protein TNCV_5085161 [Trichonephila clavipes]|uniref:Transposase n=1 Tax=Trichonephila clavipes TaxID=2585209 RepID=A0A8X6VHA8_TRICX|nr:uncharacterized protein TNCV_5085161 [Trichonephila clavipes]